MLIVFQNREKAGLLLAEKLKEFKSRKDVIVLAIPRGGVVVGKQLALNLKLPISCVVVKKLGAPGNPELAIGALAPSSVKYIDWDLALRNGVEQDYLDKEIEVKRKEVEERVRKFMVHDSWFMVKDKKIVILVDDGIATGATTLAAIKYIKQTLSSSRQARTIIAGKSTIILAIPVIAKDTYGRLQSEVDEIITLEIPESFGAVGEFYREFPQVSDDEVVNILKSPK